MEDKVKYILKDLLLRWDIAVKKKKPFLTEIDKAAQAICQLTSNYIERFKKDVEALSRSKPVYKMTDLEIERAVKKKVLEAIEPFVDTAADNIRDIRGNWADDPRKRCDTALAAIQQIKQAIEEEKE